MNPLEDKITELIIKHLNGVLNEAESRELQEWIDQSDINRKAVEDFLDENRLQQGIKELYRSKELIWQRLDKQIPDNKIVPVRRISLRIYAAAAAILVMLSAGTLYFYFNRTLKATPAVTNTNLPRNKSIDIAPGGDRAMLTLSDGQVIVLDSAKNGILKNENGVAINKAKDGELVYQSSAGNPAPENSYNTLSTPKGGQYQLKLPDGSKVWLNAASSIRYPTTFTGDERKVEITGEAYFEVAPLYSGNKKVAFIVDMLPSAGKASKGRVEVLGTHFNINAYNDEAAIKTTLLEGSVKVTPFTPMSGMNRESAILKPGEQAILTQDSRLTIDDDIDVEAAVAWKNGLFQLTSADIQTIMRQVARWYDIDVSFESTIPAGHITGKVSRNMNLSQVLKVFEFSGVHFRMDGKKLVVLP